MRIRKLSIEGLFGMFNHAIPLHTDERVTIIHGPNGVGKTTVLKLLADLFTRRFTSLGTTPYDRLVVDFEKPDRTLMVERLSPEEEERELFRHRLRFLDGERGHEYVTSPPGVSREIRRRVPERILDDLIDSLERIGPNRWIDHSTGDVLDIEEVVLRYGDQLPGDFTSVMGEIPDWLQDILSGLPVHFIQTQRLSREAPDTRHEWETGASTHSYHYS